MALSPGTRLGPYEILATAGSGGMGEVYRARDTRLDRIVAVKVLPALFSEDPVRRQRFEREARAISTLSHPHICALYDVGREGGIDFLVMEYLEGVTLADRLAKGALPPDQVLRHAIEIAGALDAAHREGVVHRDLKPGNIMLAKSGAKVLDFGLAKLKWTKGTPAAPGLSALPTVEDRPLTAEGTIVGTLQYMAPEQLEGKEADARTDIFALGTIIYEAATGRRPFTGKSQASLIAAILTAEPPSISTLRPMTPPALDRAVTTCLAKNPEERWQSARDLMRELKWISEGGWQAGVSSQASAFVRRRERIIWATFVALAAALGLAVAYFIRPTGRPQTVRFSVSPPANATSLFASVSPDGRRLAFTAVLEDRAQIWIRPLDTLLAESLTGTEGAKIHIWSPDSRFLAFLAEGKLKKIEARGGPPQTLCDVTGSFIEGTWSRDGTILFANKEAPGHEGLYRIPATGGTPSRLTVLDESERELVVAWPHFLPDGQHFVFDGTRSSGERGLYLASLNSGPAHELVPAESRVEYAPPGYLLYVRGATLLAHPFDARKLTLQGDPFPVADRVDYHEGTGLANFSVSETGTLVYGTRATSARLVWKDRDGHVTGEVGATGEYVHWRLSPDQQKVAATLVDPRTGIADLWIIELARNVSSRFTTRPADRGVAVWSPDGSRIIYTATRDAPPSLHQKTLIGSDEEVLLPPGGTLQMPDDWSPDGRFFLYANRDPNTGLDLWVLPLSGERRPAPFLRTAFAEFDATFSPDGRWVAFVSNESGQPEVYVEPFKDRGERRRVSLAGGSEPHWPRKGHELFYLAADNRLMAVPVKLGPRLELGAPQALFVVERAEIWDYDVTSDGRRFLVRASIPGSVSPVTTVVLNWAAELPHSP